LEQQTATAEVLQVINSSPGDLAPVFDAILKKAHALCGAAHGNLWTYDGELFHPVATHGNPRFAEWLRDHSSVPPGPGTVLERIVRGEAFVQSADAASDEAFCTSAYSREVIEVTGARTTLVVSLRKDTALLGVIFAYRQEVRPFSEKQIALLQNFAAQAVIAMENARLLTETREAWSSKRRLRRYCRSSIRRPATSCRCSRRSSKRRCDCARRPMDTSSPMTATAFTPPQSTATRALSNGTGSLVPFDRLQTPGWIESAAASA
jgi:GAF domain-containing protein